MNSSLLQGGAAQEGQSARQRQQLEALLHGEIQPVGIGDEELERLYAPTLAQFREGQLVKGRVVGINKNEVLIDIGAKSLAVAPRREFSELPKVGEEIEVLVEKPEDKEGRVIVSRRRAEQMRLWERIQEIYERQETVQVTITRLSLIHI